MSTEPRLRGSATGVVASSHRPKSAATRSYRVDATERKSLSSGGYACTFPSERGRRQIEANGMLELDFCILTEVDPTVTRFWKPTLEVEFYYEGKMRKQRLHFFVEHADGHRLMYVVRTVGSFHLDDAAAKKWWTDYFAMVTEGVHRHDCDFRLMTELEIRIEPRLHNARIILRGCSPLMPKHTVLAARAALQTMPPEFTIEEFRDHFHDPTVDAFNALMRLIWLGDVRPDMSRRFSNNTLIQRI